MSPTITIVTVCLNAEATVERAVISVLKQTYPNVEYIIIDGESTDGTLDILNRYRDRVTLVSEPDKGIFDAMNKALKLAHGDWLLVLGADDYLLTENTLEDAAKHFIEPDTVYYGDITSGVEGDRRHGKVSRYTALIKTIPHQAVFYPRSAYLSLEYDTRYPVVADRVYNFVLLARGVPFHYLDQVISFYSTGGYSFRVVDETYKKDEFRIAMTLGPIPFLIFLGRYCYVKLHHYLHLCKVRIHGHDQ